MKNENQPYDELPKSKRPKADGLIGDTQPVDFSSKNTEALAAIDKKNAEGLGHFGAPRTEKKPETALLDKVELGRPFEQNLGKGEGRE